jgi:hypothetical protein
MTAAHHRLFLSITSSLLAAAALAGLTLGGTRERVPRCVVELAGRAESSGWRVVATGQPGLRDGFYALPPGDDRGREQMAGLSRWLPGWGQAVVVTPCGNGFQPSEPFVWAGPGWQIHGEPEGVRAFIEACEVD